MPNKSPDLSNQTNKRWWSRIYQGGQISYQWCPQGLRCTLNVGKGSTGGPNIPLPRSLRFFYCKMLPTRCAMFPYFFRFLPPCGNPSSRPLCSHFISPAPSPKYIPAKCCVLFLVFRIRGKKKWSPKSQVNCESSVDVIGLWSLSSLVDRLVMLLVVCLLSRDVIGCEDCETYVIGVFRSISF